MVKSVPTKGKKLAEKASKEKVKEFSEEEKKAVKKTKPRIARALAERAPLLEENTKKTLFMKGHNSSEVANSVLSDLTLLAKPNNNNFTRKNEILPFEDATSLEFLMEKNDCSMLAFVNHTKKRPNNMIIGRTHDWNMLDMAELGIDKYTSVMAMPGTAKAVGAKPLLVFQGDAWNSDPNFHKLENLLLDFFRGEKINKLALKGIDHVISCSVVDDKLYIRGYNTRYVKSGTKVPDLELSPMGPFMDCTLRRTSWAGADKWAAALKRPKNVKKPRKVKNISRNDMGDKLGRIHMEKQNLDKMNTRRVTALRNGGSARASA